MYQNYKIRLFEEALINKLYKKKRKIYFKGQFSTWQEASAQCHSYDAEEILDKVLAATLKVKRGEAIYERDSVVFNQIEYAWPVLSGLMFGAARSAGRLNVLDLGGSLGSSYFQNNNFLQSLPEVRWNIVEQAHFVEAGRMHIQDVRLRFYKTIEECMTENKPNIILLSSVLQYLPNPYEVIKELLANRVDIVILDRTSYLNHGDKEVIKIQHVPESIYAASYPCHFFIEYKIISYFEERGYKLLENFDSLDILDSNSTWKGHIFWRINK